MDIKLGQMDRSIEVPRNNPDVTIYVKSPHTGFF